jgi:hypothetical protein
MGRASLVSYFAKKTLASYALNPVTLLGNTVAVVASERGV